MVVGSYPSNVVWMDIWGFFHIDLLQNCVVCLKRPKINEKEARLAHFKKGSTIVLYLGNFAAFTTLES